MTQATHRRLARSLLTAALAATALLTPGTANAGTMSTSQCSSGYLCLWSQPTYMGTFFQTGSTSVQNVSSMTVAGSAWNRSTKAARVYSGTSGSGTSVCLTPGQQVASTTISVRSVRILSGTTC